MRVTRRVVAGASGEGDFERERGERRPMVREEREKSARTIVPGLKPMCMAVLQAHG